MKSFQVIPVLSAEEASILSLSSDILTVSATSLTFTRLLSNTIAHFFEGENYEKSNDRKIFNSTIL